MLALDFHVSPASMKYLAHKAKTGGELLTLMKVIVPIVLIVMGVILLVIAILRRRKSATTAQATVAAGSDTPQPHSTAHHDDAPFRAQRLQPTPVNGQITRGREQRLAQPSRSQQWIALTTASP